MNMKKTGILSVVLAASVIYLVRVVEPSAVREEQRRMAFGTLDLNGVERVLVTRNPAEGAPESYLILNPTAGAPAKSAQTGDSEAPDPDAFKGWKIESLPGAVLDSAALGTMLGPLRELKVGDPIEDSKLLSDFSAYGLSKPSLVLVVDSKQLGKTEVAFGKKNEYLSQRYAKISGRSGVYLVDDAAFSMINKGLSDIRSKTPVTFNDTDVRKIVLQSSAGKVSLAQPAAGEWRITEPFDKAAAPLEVDNLLRAAKELRVSEFLDGKTETLQAYGLASPKVELVVSFHDGVDPKDLDLKIGQVTDPETKAVSTYFTYTGSPSIFKAAADTLASFQISAEKLRDHNLFKLSVNDIERVVTEGPGVPRVEIVANKIDWTVNGKTSDPVFVEQVLQNLVGLAASEFPAKVDPGVLSPATLKVQITKKGAAKETFELVVGKAKSNEAGAPYYARVGEGEIALIPEAQYKLIVLREETLIATPTPAPTPDKSGSE